MNKKFMLLLPVLASLMLAGCGPTSSSKSDSSSSSTGDSSSSSLPSATITAVTVTAAGDATKVALGGTLQLTATVTGTGDFGKNVTWSSSNKEVATVAAGLVTGVAAGEVTITATSKDDETKKGTITLTVAKVVSSLSEILEMAKATEYTGQAIYMGQNNKTAVKNEVETYNSIYVADGAQWYQLYNVAKSIIPADLVAGTSILEFKGVVADYLKEGKTWTTKESTVTEMSVVTDAGHTAGTWTDVADAMTLGEADINKGYKIKDATVVTKDVNTYGNVTVTFKVGAGTSVYTIYMDSRYTDVTIDAIANLAVGDIFSCSTFGGQNNDVFQFIYGLDFVSSTPDGIVSITAADSATSVEEKKTLQLTAAESGITDATFTWASSAEAVATVDANGLVTGVKAGDVVITATANDTHTATIALTVTAAPVEPTGDYELATAYDLSGVGVEAYTAGDGLGSGLSAENCTKMFVSGDLTGVTLTGTSCVTAAVGTKAYAAITTQGPKVHGLKLGARSDAGSVELTCSKTITKVVIEGYAWSDTKLADVTVNAGTAQTFVAADATAVRTFTFAIEGATTVTIASSIYSVFSKISLYTAKA